MVYMATVVESAFIPPWGASRCLHTYTQGPLHIPSDFLKSRHAPLLRLSVPLLVQNPSPSKRILNESRILQNKISVSLTIENFIDRFLEPETKQGYIYVYVCIRLGYRVEDKEKGEKRRCITVQGWIR